MTRTHLLEVEGHRPWCLRCRRPGAVCLCSEITSLRVRTKFVFLMHPKEDKKIKNGTGRIAHLALDRSELLVGLDFREHPRVVELLADPAYDCRVLYPAPEGEGEEASESSRPPGRTPVLFVIDGTWPCAKKMMKLSTNLHGLPRHSLDVDRPSEFKTKHQPDPACLATIEAVDRTLHGLAARGLEVYGAQESERLLAPFHRMVALGIAHAADPGPGSYRRSGPFPTGEERRKGRTSTASGRNVMFRGG